jgi:hypothetical protein
LKKQNPSCTATDLSLLEELIGETETALDQVVKQVNSGSRG